jgi:hypothetical protein
MGNSQWQHYLPEVYLKGFAISTGEVWRYDRFDRALKPLPPRVIGAETDLYSIVSGNEVSQEIETKWFNPLDGCFGPILRKIERHQDISPVEIMQLANFAAYLRVRTPPSIREAELRFQQLCTQVGVPSDSIKYHSEPPDHSNDSFVMTDEKSDKVSPKRGASVARNEVLEALISSGLHLANALATLDWTLLFAPSGRTFVIGDNPFVIVPPESHQTDLEGVGPLVTGAATFVPLSATVCLRMATHSPTTRLHIDGAGVRAINACQVLNSERFLFGRSDALLSRLTAEYVAGTGLNPAEVVIREAASNTDPSRSLIHSFTRSKIASNWADKMP